MKIARMPKSARYGDRIAIIFEEHSGNFASVQPRYQYGGYCWYAWIYTYQAPGSQTVNCDFILDEGMYVRLPGGTWTSSDTSVIKVYKNGKALAIGTGTATLTSSSGKKLVIKVEED